MTRTLVKVELHNVGFVTTKKFFLNQQLLQTRCAESQFGIMRQLTLPGGKSKDVSTAHEDALELFFFGDFSEKTKNLNKTSK